MSDTGGCILGPIDSFILVIQKSLFTWSVLTRMCLKIYVLLLLLLLLLMRHLTLVRRLHNNRLAILDRKLRYGSSHRKCPNHVTGSRDRQDRRVGKRDRSA